MDSHQNLESRVGITDTDVPCRNCEHPASFHATPWGTKMMCDFEKEGQRQLPDCPVEDVVYLCGCTEYEPMTKEDLEDL